MITEINILAVNTALVLVEGNEGLARQCSLLILKGRLHLFGGVVV